MPDSTAQRLWDAYRQRELTDITPHLTALGFTLDEKQPHLSGERYLMVGERDVGGGGYKLILVGTRVADGARVIIKASSEPNGREEIRTEREAREALRTLTFAYVALVSPEEIIYTDQGHRTIYITEYIEQEKPFLARPIKEQFALALAALKTQEGMHAATSSHIKFIRKTFGIWNAQTYLDSFATFAKRSTTADPRNAQLAETLEKAQEVLSKETTQIEQYCGFLTHADFVPHNLRIEGKKIYLLDYASVHFGNKHESWARFANFMLLYNRPLESALVQYLQDNRTPEEYASLRLMRIYKAGKLLEYYTESLAKTAGDLHTLTNKRIEFWRCVMESTLAGVSLSDEVIAEYRYARDALRSQEEKERQKDLH